MVSKFQIFLARVDGKIDGGLAYGRQLVPGAERVESDAISHLLDKLPVYGNATGKIEPEVKGDRFGLNGRRLHL